jgi:hypothetical protein
MRFGGCDVGNGEADFFGDVFKRRDREKSGSVFFQGEALRRRRYSLGTLGLDG